MGVIPSLENSSKQRRGIGKLLSFLLYKSSPDLLQIHLTRSSLIMSLLPNSESILVREVWGDNLESEFELIREIVDEFPYVAMVTEFPGIVIRLVGSFKTTEEHYYQTLKENVDALKLIQLGLTFSDAEGNLPTCGGSKGCTWQFNFREFDLGQVHPDNESIKLLRESGIDFVKNKQKGIDVEKFGHLLQSSGVVKNDKVHWVTFHGCYSFGYLLKALTGKELPETQPEFFKLISRYFPTVYDIKYLMKFCNGMQGGLNKVADILDVERVGVPHQAGSDSFLTSCVFMKLKDCYFNGSIAEYAGKIYGLGAE